MGKKKVVTKKAKDRSKVDERLKQIAALQPPDDNPFKQDNESNIEQFWRFGMRKRKFVGTIKQQSRKRNNKGIRV